MGVGDCHGIVGHYDKEGNEMRGGRKCNRCFKSFRRYGVKEKKRGKMFWVRES